MYKKSLLLLILFTLSLSVFSQSADSVAFIKTRWTKKRIAPKTILLTHHFNARNLFAANQNISFIEVRNTGSDPVKKETLKCNRNENQND